MNLLFVGWYPNAIEPYKNCFFQQLVHKLAKLGNKSVVIAPVSYTSYRERIREIPRHRIEIVDDQTQIDVYHPRTLSASAIQLGRFNTCKISEWFFEKAAIRYARKIRSEFDCVYGHFFLFGGLAAIKIARERNISSFVAYGECDYESQILVPYGEIGPDDIDGLSGIISVSQSNTSELRKRSVFDSIPIATIPNAVDTKLFYPKDTDLCKKEMGFPIDRKIVGFVGGFIERKGDKRVLNACGDLDDIYLAFAGKGDSKPEGPNVIFNSMLTREKVPIFLNAIDIFLLPTLNEGCCNALLEAMACRKPVISSDRPFNDGILVDGRGVRVDPTNVMEIRDAVEQLVHDDDMANEMASRAYEYAQTLSMQERARKILTFLHEHMLRGSK